MRLILMRHAEAGDADPQRYPDDRLRPLTPDGRREHQAVVQALARIAPSPTVIWTSPLTRARETADIVAHELGWTGPIKKVEALGDAFSETTLLHALRGEPDTAIALCVGHEPHLSELAARMLQPKGRIRIVLPKSGVVGLDCPDGPVLGGARLLFLLPRELYRVMET